MLASDMVLISMLTRMRLTAMGLLAASVPFTRQRKQMELLVGEEARLARRHAIWIFRRAAGPCQSSYFRWHMPLQNAELRYGVVARKCYDSFKYGHNFNEHL